MQKHTLTPAQVRLVRKELPKEFQQEGFVISFFVELHGHWRACVDLVDGSTRILQGTD